MQEGFFIGFSSLWGNADFNHNEKAYPIYSMGREERGEEHAGNASLKMQAFLHTAGGGVNWCELCRERSNNIYSTANDAQFDVCKFTLQI